MWRGFSLQFGFTVSDSCFFILFNSVFWRSVVLKFNEVWFISFSFIRVFRSCCLCPKKSLPNPWSQKFYTMFFFLEVLKVLGFNLVRWFGVNIFLMWYKVWIKVQFFACGYPIVQASFVENGTFVKNQFNICIWAIPVLSYLVQYKKYKFSVPMFPVPLRWGPCCFWLSLLTSTPGVGKKTLDKELAAREDWNTLMWMI